MRFLQRFYGSFDRAVNNCLVRVGKFNPCGFQTGIYDFYRGFFSVFSLQQLCFVHLLCGVNALLRPSNNVVYNIGPVDKIAKAPPL